MPARRPLADTESRNFDAAAHRKLRSPRPTSAHSKRPDDPIRARGLTRNPGRRRWLPGGERLRPAGPIAPAAAGETPPSRGDAGSPVSSRHAGRKTRRPLRKVARGGAPRPVEDRGIESGRCGVRLPGTVYPPSCFFSPASRAPTAREPTRRCKAGFHSWTQRHACVFAWERGDQLPEGLGPVIGPGHRVVGVPIFR